MRARSYETGAVNPLLISSILLAILSAGLAGVSLWSYTNYLDQKNNTDAKIETAVTAAEKTQAETLEKNFVEREKQPYKKFNGPSDLGNVTFDFPKTWSTYVASNDGAYTAYLNPGVVPAISNTQPYAVRVIIDNESYESSIKRYESTVKKGDLKSSPITINGFTGVRLDGRFSKEREGSAVVFKVRDKTLTIATDASAFRADYDTIIIKSLDFNP